MAWQRTRGLLVCVLALWVWFGCHRETEPPVVPVDPATQSMLIAGTEALKQHEFEAALALVDSAAKRRPDLADVYFLQGRIYSEMAHFEEAEAAYRKVLELRPDYRGVWNNLANNAVRRFEYRTAVDLYHRELEQHPAPIPWRGLGRAYRELGIVDSARHAYEQAIALDSTYAPVYISYAQLLEDEGELQEALSYATRALAINPDDMEARYMVGSLQVRTGQSDEALPHLREVVEAWPWHEGAHYNMGQALVRSGEEQEGRRYLEKAEDLRALQARIDEMDKTVRGAPRDPYAHAGLASALRLAGRYNDAMHAYKVALYLDPDNLEFRNNVAVLHLLRGEHDAAVQKFRRILEIDPAFVEVWLNLGIVLVKSGRPDEAREAWLNALRYQPDNEAARAYLARLNGDS